MDTSFSRGTAQCNTHLSSDWSNLTVLSLPLSVICTRTQVPGSKSNNSLRRPERRCFTTEYRYRRSRLSKRQRFSRGDDDVVDTGGNLSLLVHLLGGIQAPQPTTTATTTAAEFIPTSIGLVKRVSCLASIQEMVGPQTYVRIKFVEFQRHRQAFPTSLPNECPNHIRDSLHCVTAHHQRVAT